MDYKEENVSNCGRRNNRNRFNRMGYGLVVVAACCLIGCTTVKKAGVSATTAAVGATVATALSGGVAAPILGGTTGAFVGSAVSDLMITNPQCGISKAQGMTDCAPDNLWSVLGLLIEMGGWALILFFLLPILIGWILPGPTKLNRK